MNRILLITANPSLYGPAEELSRLFGAELLIESEIPEGNLPRADFLLWHTDMQYDKHIYHHLRSRYSKIIVLCSRERPERLGAGPPIDVPYIILPLYPEEAAILMKHLQEKEARDHKLM